MKKKDVVIGARYLAKVSGARTTVKILSESQFGGWDGLNLTTNRKIRIKSAQRLHQILLDPDTAPNARAENFPPCYVP